MSQYYAHREKLRLVGREGDLERLNTEALGLARQVATATGTLMAGNLCNTTVYQRDDPTALEKTRKIFEVRQFHRKLSFAEGLVQSRCLL